MISALCVRQEIGCYGVTLQYLNTIADVSLAAAKAGGGSMVERMKRIPTDDDVLGVGHICEGGRRLHEMHLFEVKKPSKSQSRWDVKKFAAPR